MTRILVTVLKYALSQPMQCTHYKYISVMACEHVLKFPCTCLFQCTCASCASVSVAACLWNRPCMSGRSMLTGSNKQTSIRHHTREQQRWGWSTRFGRQRLLLGVTPTLGLEGPDEQEYTARQCIGGTKCFIRGKIVSAPSMGQETCEVLHGGDKQRQMQAEGCSRSSRHISELTCS